MVCRPTRIASRRLRSVGLRSAGTTIANNRSGGHVMRCGFRLFAATTALAFLGVAASAAQADGWIGSWGASDVFPVGPDVRLPDVASVRSTERRREAGADTLLQCDRPVSAGHRRLLLGKTGLRCGAGDDRSCDRPRADLRGRANGVTVAPGAEVVSDPVDIDLPPLSTLAISMFVPRWHWPSCNPPRWGRDNQI